MKVTVLNDSLSAYERDLYIEHIINMHPEVEIEEILLDAEGMEIRYQAKVRRRVLAKQGGSVIGDPAMWNDAKRAEYIETVPNCVLDLF